MWRKVAKLLCHPSEKMVIFHAEFTVQANWRRFAASATDRGSGLLWASVFWLRRLAALGGEERIITEWQVKRDGTFRGIIEIVGD